MDADIIRAFLKYSPIGAPIAFFLLVVWVIVGRLKIGELNQQRRYKILLYVLAFAFLVFLVGLIATMCSPRSTHREPVGQADKNDTFCLSELVNSELQHMIADSTGLVYSLESNPTYDITFAYSGALRQGGAEGYCTYKGGCVLIRINGSPCQELKELALPGWPDNPGNPCEFLRDQLNDSIGAQLSTHPAMVAAAIARCIHAKDIRNEP